MEIRETPTAEAAMLIRRPVADVFEAIVDPAIDPILVHPRQRPA